MPTLESLIKDRIISKEKQYDKNGSCKCIRFICHCPTEGCNGTVTIEKHAHIDNKCRSCSVAGRVKVRTNIYIISTALLNEVHFDDAKRFASLFIKEEVSLDRKHYRYVLKCPNDGCCNTITIRHNYTPKPCRSCCRQKRPYERTYNHGKKERSWIKNNGVAIKWLISYEEFAFLCEIKNCHYCNKLLYRAKYKAEEGTNSILLDRKDSNKDYSVDNCVPCCPECNFTKNEHISYDEMVLIMKYRGLWIDKNA